MDDDPDNNGQQSDFVTIMMNLGSIPDFVASRIDCGANFSAHFMGLMDEYKKTFETDHGIKWDYSNPKLLDRYVTFKRTHESVSRNYEKSEGDKEGGKEGGEIEMK